MKKTDIYKKVILWLFLGVVSSILAHFIIDYLFYDYNFEVARRVMTDTRTEVFILGAAILFIIYTLFSSLFGSSAMGAGTLLMLSWLIGTVTRYKSIYRAEPLYPNEFYMVKELPFLMKMIGLKRSLLIALGLLFIIALLFAFYKYVIKARRKGTGSKEENIMRITGVLISVGLLFYIGRFNYPNNKVKAAYNDHVHWVDYNQNKNYSDNGFVAGFLSNLKAPPMDTPENYSKATMEDIYEKYFNIAQDTNQNRDDNQLDTNVLFVMNESFSDPFNLTGIESNKDPLNNYREIIEETISGNILAPNYGGGTATNEFEVLTGFAMEPFASQITSPYIQLTTQMTNFPSVANRFNQLEYRTTAIHPHTPGFYRREDVYSNLNFDEFRHQDNMNNTEKISDTHRYISDFSAYKEIFDVMENSQEPDFIHLVTMQNHTSYAEKYDYVDFEVEGSGNPSEANAYFKDLENSDVSLRLFINQINDFDEPVLLVFWGDHLPGFYEGEVLEANEGRTLYEAPFFVYSNKIALDSEVELISPSFLRNYITEVLELKVSPYEALLTELQSHLPVVDKRLYIEEESSKSVHSRNDLSANALEVLKDYSLLMYDITTGNQYAHELEFFE